MLAYMLDPDISSYIMKRSHAAVLRRLQSVEVAEVSISAITKCELMYGVEVSPQRQRDETALGAFLRHVQVLDFSAGAAIDYARIRADLKQRIDRGQRSTYCRPCAKSWTDPCHQQHS